MLDTFAQARKNAGLPPDYGPGNTPVDKHRQHADAVSILGIGKPRKWRGRPKGKLQMETVARIENAAALKFLKYSQRNMAPLLYPGTVDREEGRKKVQKFLNRHRSAVDRARTAMTVERAEQIKRSFDQPQ